MRKLQFSPGCPKSCLRAPGILCGQPRFRFPDGHFRRFHLKLVAYRVNPDERLVRYNGPAVGKFGSYPDYASRYFGTYSHLVVCPDCAGQLHRQRLLGGLGPDHVDDRFGGVRILTGHRVKGDAARRPGKVQGNYNQDENNTQLGITEPRGTGGTVFRVVCLLLHVIFLMLTGAANTEPARRTAARAGFVIPAQVWNAMLFVKLVNTFVLLYIRL